MGALCRGRCHRLPGRQCRRALTGKIPEPGETCEEEVAHPVDRRTKETVASTLAAYFHGRLRNPRSRGDAIWPEVELWRHYNPGARVVFACKAVEASFGHENRTHGAKRLSAQTIRRVHSAVKQHLKSNPQSVRLINSNSCRDKRAAVVFVAKDAMGACFHWAT
jgi:hypothetical protein